MKKISDYAKTFKPGSTKVIFIIGAFIMAALLWFLFSTTCSSVRDAEEFNRVYANPLTVTATVKEYDSYDDDNDTDYRSYVEYEVNGTLYLTKYEDKNTEEELTPIGEKVTLKVSPENPGRSLSDLVKSARNVPFIITITLIMLSLFLLPLMDRGRKSKENPLQNEEVLVKDIKSALLCRAENIALLLIGSAYAGLAVRYPLIYGKSMAVFAIALLAAWVICMARALHGCSLAKRGEYEIRCDKLVEKKYISGDESDTYRLIYSSNNGETWKVNVSKSRYEREAIGNNVHAVYLSDRDKPVLHYDGKGEIG